MVSIIEATIRVKPPKKLGKSAGRLSYTICVSAERTKLQEQFEDYARSLVQKEKKSLEEIFQATLDITTPAVPGDLRTTREWRDPNEPEAESQWL